LEIRPRRIIGNATALLAGVPGSNPGVAKLFFFAFLDYLLFRRGQVLAAVPSLSSLPISTPICLFTQLAAFIVCAVVGRKSLSPANQESIEQQQALLEIGRVEELVTVTSRKRVFPFP